MPPAMEGWSVNHWTAREVSQFLFLISKKSLLFSFLKNFYWSIVDLSVVLVSGVQQSESVIQKIWNRDFPGGAVVKNPPTNEGDTGLIPGSGRSHMPRSN